MDFNRTGPTCYGTFSLTPVPTKNAAFSYIVLCLTYIRGLILELSCSFPVGAEREVILPLPMKAQQVKQYNAG